MSNQKDKKDTDLTDNWGQSQPLCLPNTGKGKQIQSNKKLALMRTNDHNSGNPKSKM